MRISLLFITTFFAQIVFCQDTYYKSSIITLKNDTIKGFISNIYDAKAIKFKHKKDSEPVLYTPNLLRGFILDGNVFETKVVNVPYYKKKYASMADAEQLLAKEVERGRYIDTAFLHKLIHGTVSLYKMTNLEGFTYFFVQKNGVLRELPPQYFTAQFDTVATLSRINMNNVSNFATYIHIHDDYLDTLGYVLNDRRFTKLPSKTFSHSQKSLSSYVMLYNKNKGISNGGLLKSKVSRKIFTGVSVGTLYLQYDDKIKDTKIDNAIGFKIYGLYPLLGTNRNVFAKFGLNYFTYSNDFYKKSIPSASFGLRYSAISGRIRPYIEGSAALSLLNINNRPQRVDFPMLFEGGVNIPVKNFFITAGVTLTPIIAPTLNGYKFAAFNVGILF